LIGKLFDEAGEGLTPSHAVKGNRPHRYYVSRSLLKETANALRGCRVPALELERNLANAVAGILDEYAAIAADVDEAGLDAHDLTSIFASAKEWSARLRSEAEAAPALKTLVERAELHQEGIRLSVRLPISISATATANIPADLLLTRQIPLKVKRRGVELRLVIGAGSGSSPRVDPTILKAIARAHRWFDDLESGRSASMVEIGRREGVSERYVSRMIGKQKSAGAEPHRAIAPSLDPDSYGMLDFHRAAARSPPAVSSDARKGDRIP
jgi:site-specific DNA recombinase